LPLTLLAVEGFAAAVELEIVACGTPNAGAAKPKTEKKATAAMSFVILWLRIFPDSTEFH